MSSRPGKITLAITAFIVTLICLFGHLGALGLVGPDEPRYAWIARAMARTGDWVTPRLYGRPWLEKPALYYWAAGFFFRFMSQPEWAARLPSAFAALLAVLAMVRTAMRHFGEETPYATAFILPTTVAAIGFARAAAPDMLFSAALAAALASATSIVILRTNAGAPGPLWKEPSPLSLISWGAWLGMAVLAKGPAGIALAGGSVALWALATRNWRLALRLLHPLAVLSFCVVALPWYTYCAIRNPDFLRIFFWQHNFERYTRNTFQHHQPIWFFAEILLLGFLPWTALLLPATVECVRAWKQRSERNSVTLFLACWVIFPILFFSFSQSKLPNYALPVFPPLSLIGAASICGNRAMESRPARWAVVAVAFTLAAVALIESFLSPHVFSLDIHWNPALFGYGVAGSLGVGLLERRRKRLAALALASIVVAGLVEYVNLKYLPGHDSAFSPREISQVLKNLPPSSPPVFTFHVDRAWQYGASFYLDRDITEWPSSEPKPALLLTSPQSFEELRRHGEVKILWDQHSLKCALVEIQPLPGIAAGSGYRAASGSD